jgi:hypothetical protein
MKDESKQSSEHTHEEPFDFIEVSEIDSINQALQLINHSQFEVLQVKKFQSLNSNVQQISTNETFTKFLLTNSDRTLRLY